MFTYVNKYIMQNILSFITTLNPVLTKMMSNSKIKRVSNNKDIILKIILEIQKFISVMIQS
jgi:hypothetical protein